MEVEKVENQAKDEIKVFIKRREAHERFWD